MTVAVKPHDDSPEQRRALIDVLSRPFARLPMTPICTNLTRPDGAPLPAAEPGAHIDLHLPNGMTRQYSLVIPRALP